jgi:hypothetical protein
MFGYSKTFPQEQKSRKRWWLAGRRGMYDDDAAEMRCTTRQEDVSTEWPYRLSRHDHDMSEAGSCMWP